jgi:hypothetical protein
MQAIKMIPVVGNVQRFGAPSVVLSTQLKIKYKIYPKGGVH